MLGIDDRTLDPGDGGLEASTLAPTDGEADGETGLQPDVGPVVTPPVVTPPVCNEACGRIGGTCVADTKCLVTCNDDRCRGTQSAPLQLACPPDHQCVVQCGDDDRKHCEYFTCTGGRSCLTDCSNKGCRAVDCGSPACAFACGEPKECKSGEAPLRIRCTDDCVLTCGGPCPNRGNTCCF